MTKQIEIGDTVTPVTWTGLWLADVPVNGKYHQKRNDVCIFKGEGKVLKKHKCIIDYDEWVEHDRILEYGELHSVGKVEYINLLIECDDGIGWAGLNAVTKED